MITDIAGNISQRVCRALYLNDYHHFLIIRNISNQKVFFTFNKLTNTLTAYAKYVQTNLIDRAISEFAHNAHCPIAQVSILSSSSKISGALSVAIAEASKERAVLKYIIYCLHYIGN